MNRAVWVGALVFLIGAALTVDKRGMPGALYADEGTYYGMSRSLAADRDLVFAAEDLARINADFASGASGVIVEPRGRELVYSKPILYPLVAALPAALFGANGLLLVNVLAWCLAMLAIAAHLRWCAGARDADFFALSFILASAAPAYLTWMMPECLVMGLVGAGLALSLTPLLKRSVDPGPWARWLGHPRAALVGGLLLGAAASQRYPNALLLIAPVVAALLARRWRWAGEVSLGAILALALLLGATRLLTGHFDPYTTPRMTYARTLEGWPPLTAPDRIAVPERKDWPGIPPEGLATPRLLAYGALYSLVGRHTGMALYFAPGLLALVVGLRRRRWPLLLALGALQGALLLRLPGNYFGGAAFVGNRYLAAIYPAFAFFLTAVPSRRTMLGLWAWAGLTVSAVMLTPFWPRALDPSTQARTHAGLFRWAPVESTAAEIDGQVERAWSGLWVRGVDPYARLGDDGLRLRAGGPPAEILVAAPERLARLLLVVRSEVPGRLALGDWANSRQDAIPAGVDTVVAFKLSDAWRQHEMRFDSRVYHVYDLSLGFVSDALAKDDWPVDIGLMVSAWVEDEAAYKAELLSSVLPDHCLAGEHASASVVVRNSGARAWTSHGAAAVRPGYQWLQNGAIVEQARGRIAGNEVPPGEKWRLELDLVCPSAPGEYTLEAGPVMEHVRWLGSGDGTAPLRQTVIVEPAPAP